MKKVIFFSHDQGSINAILPVYNKLKKLKNFDTLFFNLDNVMDI